MRQRTNSNKSSNINKTIIMKSLCYQEMTLTQYSEKIIEFRVIQEPQFPHLGTFCIRKFETFLRRC